MAPTPPGSITETLVGLRIGLAGMTDLPASSRQSWEQITAEFSQSFILNAASASVQNFVTTYEVTTVAPVAQRRVLLRGQQRELQQDAIMVVYTQTKRYDITGDGISPEIMATAPFAGDDGKLAYVALLKSSDDLVLQGVAGVSSVLVPNTQPPAMSPVDEDDPVLSLPAIIGIACGGGALLICVVLYFLYCHGGGGDRDKDIKSADDPPLHVNVRDDEISTLAGPTGPPTYGDQRYVKIECCEEFLPVFI
jgi:hypothetical protein